MQSPFNQISLIGYGNVGSHLFALFQQNGIRVSHILSKSDLPGEVKEQTIQIRDLNDLPDNQLAIVCVNDDSIPALLELIKPTIPVAYTSGSVNISDLKTREDLGVFYPLQTFRKGHTLRTPQFPILIEANNLSFESRLTDFARIISNKVQIADSTDRAKIHLVAVWVNNFTNHLMHLAKQRSKTEQIDFELLKPLMMETVLKLQDTDPFDAQTGPARRGDTNILAFQANKLSGIEREIYELINRSIADTYNT